MSNMIRATDIIDDWRNNVLTGNSREIWRVGGPEWNGFEFGPGIISILGGAPGQGKTALSMQFVFEALQRQPKLSALVANVEMAPEVLLDRQLARLTGTSLSRIKQDKNMHDPLILDGIEVINEMASRLYFMSPPYTLEEVANVVDEVETQLLVIDYIQRFKLSNRPKGDQRMEIDAMMGYLRQFSNEGIGILVISSVSRQSGSRGSTYSGLNLASFRGSSELEFAADSAWILCQTSEDDESPDDNSGEDISIHCCKNRHGCTPTLYTRFHKGIQHFTLENSIGLPEDVEDGGDNTFIGDESVVNDDKNTDNVVGDDELDDEYFEKLFLNNSLDELMEYEDNEVI